MVMNTDCVRAECVSVMNDRVGSGGNKLALIVFIIDITPNGEASYSILSVFEHSELVLVFVFGSLFLSADADSEVQEVLERCM